MTPTRAKRIAKTFHKLHNRKNGTTFRNAINQTAHTHKTSERRVHAALFATQHTH